jgi:hypothetical protein
MDAALTWYQNSALASAVGNSPTITAVLSAFHALGFTFIMGGALFANLGTLRVLFPSRPVGETAGPGSGLIALGLVLSVPTGILLFGPRAVNAAHNSTFQLKLLLILAASAVQFGLLRRGTRAVGALGLTLWIALALTACAFILLE